MRTFAFGVTVCGLVALLIVGPFLGSAAGNFAPHIWNKYPRSPAKFRADSPHVGWKKSPGTTAAAAPVVLALLLGLAPTSRSVVAASGVPRPPFVPPRS